MDQKDFITDSCTQMMFELQQLYDPDKVCLYFNLLSIFVLQYIVYTVTKILSQVKVKIKVVSGSQLGAVAAEAKRTKTHWVVLDK